MRKTAKPGKSAAGDRQAPGLQELPRDKAGPSTPSNRRPSRPGAAMPQEHRAGARSGLAPEGDPGPAVMTGCPATLAVGSSSSRRKVSLAVRDSDDGRHPPGRFSHPCRRSGCRRGYCSKKGRRIVRVAAARIPAADEEAPRVAKSAQYEPSFTPCFARRAWSVAKVQSLKGKSGKRSREKLSRTLRRGS